MRSRRRWIELALVVALFVWGAGAASAGSAAGVRPITDAVWLGGQSAPGAGSTGWTVLDGGVLCPATHVAVDRDAVDRDAVDRDAYYARSTLAPGERACYDAVYDGLAAMRYEIDVSGLGLPVADVERLLHYVASDAPELFWWTGNATVGYQDEIVLDVRPEYGYTADEVRALQPQIDAAAAEILAGIPDGAGEYDRVWLIATALSTRIAYDQSVAEAGAGPIDPGDYDHQTIVGGLLDGRAVCAGITRSFQYLLYRVGIVSFCVTGMADSGLSGVPPGPHAWNLLRVDGGWYYADLTNAMPRVAAGDASGFLQDETAILAHCQFEDVRNIDDPSDDVNENPPLPATGAPAAAPPAPAEAVEADDVHLDMAPVKRIYGRLQRGVAPGSP